MTHQKGKDLLSLLDFQERAEVLDQILNNHPALRDEANSIARDLLDEASVGVISEEVTGLVLSIDLESLNDRAGEHRWGYVEPSEAAWELLEESIEGIQKDMTRKMQASLSSAAEKLCQGIVIGLYNATKRKNDGVLDWAPDFPAEAAAQCISDLVELYPQNRRKAAAKRIVVGVEKQTVEWLDMLQRTFEWALSSKRPTRKRK